MIAVIIIGFISAYVLAIATLKDCANTNDGRTRQVYCRTSQFLIVLGFILNNWFLLWTHVPYEFGPVHKEIVQVYDGQAIINIDGKPINLNHKTGKNYTDGELVDYQETKPGFYLGVYESSSIKINDIWIHE